MEKILRQSLLFDFYGELLTEHQKSVYSDYILNDIGLSEIASERGISRQGVHDLVKRCESILENYENKLGLLEKFLETKTLVKEIHDITNKFDYLNISDDEKELINRITEISNNIIESM